MAKRKYEFRPDKTDSGIANKLYLTQTQRRSLWKWLAYSALCVAALVLQDSMLARLGLFGGVVDLTPAAILLICVAEGAHGGAVFALTASMLYVFSGTGQGTWCILLLTVLGIGAAAFRQLFLRRSFSSELIAAGSAVFLYELSQFFIGLAFSLTHGGRLGAFLMTALMSTAALAALYPLVRRIGAIGGEQWKE